MIRRLPRRIRKGFSLVELLVVIVIIISLAVLSMMGVQRMRFGAAKSTTASQMRQIAISTSLWAAENNNGEPFYVANGTGTYSDECIAGANPKLSPANPPSVLYDKINPGNGYLTDHTLFFSPLVKAKAPVQKDYHPDKSSATKPWGNYVWYYPYTNNPTKRQSDAMFSYWLPNTVTKLDKKLLMITDYTANKSAWKKYYLGLMIDGAVREMELAELPIRPQT